MRVISTFEKENLARRFSMFLQKQEIDNTVDVEVDDTSKKFSYQVWVHDEDRLPTALEYLEDFNKDPKDSKFDVSIKEVFPEPKETIDKEEVLPPPPLEIKPKNVSFTITAIVLFICVFVYFLNGYQEKTIKKEDPKIVYVLLTPIQGLFLFDVPYVLMKVDKVIRKYHIDPSKEISAQSVEAQKEMEAIDEIPFWKGVYEIVLSKKQDPKSDIKIKGMLFEKIRHGQVWRLFTPCLLHKDFFHILFNMLWLWLLGKQIEQRLSKFKYIALILVVGIFSNIAQYMMSGPYFLGYSGVIMGMVGFIWARQQIAPWEGYPLQKMVLMFLCIYVLLMFALSFFSFMTQIVGLNLFAPNIANTAHIAGGLVGWILGRMSCFSWSPHHER